MRTLLIQTRTKTSMEVRRRYVELAQSMGWSYLFLLETLLVVITSSPRNGQKLTPPRRDDDMMRSEEMFRERRRSEPIGPTVTSI
jgi:hypothetical protein